MFRALKRSCLMAAVLGMLTWQLEADALPSNLVHSIFASHDFADGTATEKLTGLQAGFHDVGIVCSPQLWTFLKANGQYIRISLEGQDGSFHPIDMKIGGAGGWKASFSSCYWLGSFETDLRTAKLRISLPREVMVTDPRGFLIVVTRSPEETEATF